MLVARSDHTTGSKNIKLKVVFKVQKMARYASFCLIMGPFKGEVPVFARLWHVRVRVRVSFMTGAVRSAIIATAGFLYNRWLARGRFARTQLTTPDPPLFAVPNPSMQPANQLT